VLTTSAEVVNTWINSLESAYFGCFAALMTKICQAKQKSLEVVNFKGF